MSSIRRTRTTRTKHSILTAFIIGTVTSLGLALGTPVAGAFAIGNPTTAEARVAHSIESGHLFDDMESGKISEADIIRAAGTGFDVGGRHFGKWIDLSETERVDLEAKTQDLRANLAADPELMASKQGAESTSPATQSSPTASSPIEESKHWWNHLIHWFTIHLNNGAVRSIIAGAAGFGGFALCSTLDLSRASCALVGAFFAGGSELLRTSSICNGRGISIPIPDTWHSHCR
ncbi:hypothetical protein DZF93_00240 [Clavibacter michiganensis subsp. insidiosus]|uniref:Uncharacterized protein n=1 Tax=Clavibacter michiganensis subsp. insidiosus TaxID=33014 RepID=A0A399ST94_9MICO|nr:hypothetical protein DZF93_00240 [Clavibacter michiganensis subsp. insidiosus]